MEGCDVHLCDSFNILKHELFKYFHIGNVNTQNNVDEPGPQLVVEPPPQWDGAFDDEKLYYLMHSSSICTFLISVAAVEGIVLCLFELHVDVNLTHLAKYLLW